MTLKATDREQLAALAEGLSALRTGVLWTLLLSVGCVAIPTIGGAAWAFLLLASGWRAIGRHRLEKEGFLDEFNEPSFLRAFTPLVHAELAVGIAVAFLTVASSMGNFPLIVAMLLALLRIAWIGLIAVNNLLTLHFALAVDRRCGNESTSKFTHFAPHLIFGSAACFVPLLALRLIGECATITFPEQLLSGVGLIVGIGCLAGIASVLLIYTELTAASEALAQSRRAPTPTPPPRSRRRPQPPRDEPPKAGSGDVIPFADDPPGPFDLDE